jgi:hypothetical protein
MIGSIQPVTRRSFSLLLLIAPMACLGCGDGEAVVTDGGEKRRQKAEDLEKKAETNRANAAKKKGR